MPRHACEGIRVVDFSSSRAGALATMILSDNGAEVVKVEPPGGDLLRRQPAFVQWYRGKKSVVLDLGEPEARRQARALAAWADVMVESFPPGTAGRVGLDFDSLSE